MAYYQRGEHAVGVVEALLTAYPAAAQMPCADGSLPLHIACAYQTGKFGLAIVKLIHAAYPKAARYRTKDGRMALDLAQQMNTSERDIIKFLKKASR